jgi:hypothetical protein
MTVRLDAAQLVSEGVTFSAQSGTYTYRFAIDNRAGTDEVYDAAILVAPNVFLRQVPVQQTSPFDWRFSTSFGGNPSGTFQEWFAPLGSGVAPGQYLSGFSLSTIYGPHDMPYSLSHRTLGDPPDRGVVSAPDVLPAIPVLQPAAALLFCVALALVGFAGCKS